MPTTPGYPVVIDDPVGCPVFVARTVSGFDPAAPTPDWMATRLALSGQRPISLAVDVTNYVMLELGRPIHGYDADKLSGPIGVRRARAGERLTTLDGVDRELSEEDLVVTDDSGIIGLGGVMGGATTEISETTTRILVEAAHWDAVSMFRTGRRHKLTSEAGKRNERGVDPVITPAAADRVVELLTTYGGGTADPGVTVVGTPPPPPVIRLDPELPARITGIDISAERTRDALVAVGCTIEATDDAQALAVTPPTWRPDLTDPYDLVEEVARVVGYDQVPSVLPREAAGRGLTREQRLRRRIGRTLAGAGCVEVISFPFVGEAAFDQLGLDARRRAPAAPSGWRTRCRRRSRRTRPRCCRACSAPPRATSAAAPRASRCSRPAPWRSRSTAGRPRSTAWTGDPATTSSPSSSRRSRGSRCISRSCWRGSGSGPAGGAPAARPAGRTRSGSCAASAPSSGVEVSVSSTTRTPWHPGRCAELRVGGPDGAVLGHAGELHPRVCESVGLPVRSAAVEIDLDVLMAHAVDVVAGPELSTYPVAKEDVALVVEDSVTAAQVEAALRGGRRRAAGVDPALRRLHRRAGRRRAQVARLRAALPGARPDPDRGGGRCRPGRRGRAGGRAARRPAALSRVSRRPG